MSTTTHTDEVDAMRRTLMVLEDEANVLGDDINALQAQLDEKRQRAERVWTAVRALQAVLGADDATTTPPPNVGVPAEAVPSDESGSDDSPLLDGARAAIMEMARAAGAVTAEAKRPKIKRIRSTNEVARIVNAADRALTRDEIQEAFMDEVDIPDTWTNPPNAINNALLRAVNSGLVLELEDGRFTAMPSST